MLHLGEIKIAALVDTGASRSLLRRDVFEAHIRATRRAPYLRRTTPLQGVNGDSLQVLGSTWLNVKGIDVPLDVMITCGIQHPLIIGQDALRKGEGVIDVARNTMRWFGRVWTTTAPRTHKAVTSVGPIAPETGHPSLDVLVRDYGDLFSAKGEAHGNCNLVSLTIKTWGPPICQKAYRAPLTKRHVIEEQVAEMLRDGVIQPSSSPWSSPVTLQAKSDGTQRFCCDFRRLNAVTEADTYPLPLISLLKVSSLPK